MANSLDGFDPTFYALEAISLLQKRTGMGNRVYMGYNEERKSFSKGQYISVPKPSELTTQAGGTGTVQDVTTDEILIRLNRWRECKFGLTDQELAYTGEGVLSPHAERAVYKLALDINNDLTLLRKDVPWFYNAGSTISYADFLGCRKVLADNIGSDIMMRDNYFAIDTTLEAGYLGLTQFSDVSSAGESQGLYEGVLNTRANVQPFVNQSLTDHTSGTVVSAGNDNAGALTADASQGATTIAVDGLNGAETLLAGDTFVIAGNTQRYAVTATTTLTTGAGSVSLWPPLVTDYSDNDVVTFEADSSTVHAGSYSPSIMFNRNAFALAFAPLPETGDGAGTRITTVSDPMSGYSIRSRISYDDTKAKPVITLDVLYGYKTIDPNRAVIFRRNKA